MGHLFENQSEFSTDDKDNEPLIFHKKAKKKQTRTGWRKMNNEFQFPVQKIQSIASYENQTNRIANKSCASRFFDYFRHCLFDRMSDYTGRKIVENGSDMHVSKPILFNFFALTS